MPNFLTKASNYGKHFSEGISCSGEFDRTEELYVYIIHIYFKNKIQSQYILEHITYREVFILVRFCSNKYIYLSKIFKSKVKPALQEVGLIFVL